jgi:hypothetical protein
MAFLAPEALAAGAEALGVGAEAGGGAAAAGGEAAGGGGLLSGITRNFNDAPVGQTVGSKFGKAVVRDLAAHDVVHGLSNLAGGSEGGGGGGQLQGPSTGGVDIGPIANA